MTPDPNPGGESNPYSYRYGHCKSNGDRDTNAPGYTNAQTAPDTGTALIGTIRAGTREQTHEFPVSGCAAEFTRIF